MKWKTFVWRTAWVFYAWALVEAWSLLSELTHLSHQPGIRAINWEQAGEMTAITVLTLVTARGLQRGRIWAIWLAGGMAVWGFLLSPGTVLVLAFIGACVAAGASMWRRIPRAIVL